MKKIREIIKLKSTTDLSVRQISKALSVSRPVVSEYLQKFESSGLKYDDIINMADSELLSIFQCCCVSFLAAFGLGAMICVGEGVGGRVSLFYECFSMLHDAFYFFEQFA